jgi:hypothetical protein
MFSVISWGIPTGLATSSAAPFADMLRIVQSTPLPSNSMVPALKRRFRCVARRSSMLPLLKQMSNDRVNVDGEIISGPITIW